MADRDTEYQPWSGSASTIQPYPGSPTLTQILDTVKDILALKPYIRVARLGSFSAAAREFGLSQSQVSRIMHTDLMNSCEAEQAMPLDAFIDETIVVLGTDSNEVRVEGAKLFRSNPGPGEYDWVNGFNAQTLEGLSG